MKQQSIKNKVLWIESFILTTALIITSLSFLATEWKTISGIGKGVFDLAKSVAEKMITGLV